MLEINEDETLCLYRFMKKQEEDLENCLVRLLTRVEKKLYETMSIEELEHLAENG